MKVQIQRRSTLPPEGLRDAFEAWMTSGASLKPGESDRTFEQIGPGQFRFVRTGRTRAGPVRVEGIVRFRSTDRWDLRQTTELAGRPFADERRDYLATAAPGGSVLSVEVEVESFDELRTLLLPFAKRRLVQDRGRELDRWVPGSQPLPD